MLFTTLNNKCSEFIYNDNKKIVFKENKRVLEIDNSIKKFVIYQKGEHCIQKKICNNNKICDYIIFISNNKKLHNASVLILLELKGQGQKEPLEQIYATINCLKINRQSPPKEKYVTIITSKLKYPRLSNEVKRQIKNKLGITENNFLIKNQNYTFYLDKYK